MCFMVLWADSDQFFLVEILHVDTTSISTVMFRWYIVKKVFPPYLCWVSLFFLVKATSELITLYFLYFIFLLAEGWVKYAGLYELMASHVLFNLGIGVTLILMKILQVESWLPAPVYQWLLSDTSGHKQEHIAKQMTVYQNADRRRSELIGRVRRWFLIKKRNCTVNWICKETPVNVLSL